MSFNSWKNEFYPNGPKGMRPLPYQEPVIAAIDHSLRKWKGMLPENLAKHNVALTRVDSREHGCGLFVHAKGRLESPGYRLPINDTSCSLCKMCTVVNDTAELKYTYIDCPACPLYTQLGGKACDTTIDDGVHPTGPYIIMMVQRDPTPMIEHLEAALKTAKAAHQ